MTVAYDRRRESRAPALAAALVLHAGLFLALISVSRPAFLPTGSSVPINIVATGPTTDSRPAEQAPIAQEAQVETPVPQAKAPTPPPAPPQPIVAAQPPKPAPSKPAKDTFSLSSVQADIAQKQSFSLNALQAEVAKAAKSQPARPAFARRGPTRAETAPEARVDAGSGVSQSDIAGLSDLLNRLWNKDCNVENPVVIPLKFTIGFDGHVQGPIYAFGRVVSLSTAPVPVERAVDAVHQAAPYADTYRGLTITVRFDSKKACAQRN
jgi:type IV secretory pathway VirB10-like protein